MRLGLPPDHRPAAQGAALDALHARYPKVSAMPRPVFWRRMTKEERAELDAEVQRRAYADTHGIAAWLADRGISVTKTPVHQYARKLKRDDDALSISTDDIPPETARLIVEAVVLTAKALKAFGRVLDATRRYWKPNHE